MEVETLREATGKILLTEDNPLQTFKVKQDGTVLRARLTVEDLGPTGDQVSPAASRKPHVYLEATNWLTCTFSGGVCWRLKLEQYFEYNIKYFDDPPISQAEAPGATYKVDAHSYWSKLTDSTKTRGRSYTNARFSSLWGTDNPWINMYFYGSGRVCASTYEKDLGCID